MKAMAKYLHASDVRHLGQAFRGIRISLYTHIGAYARSQGTKIGTLRSLPSQKKTPPLEVEDFLAHADRAELQSRATCELWPKGPMLVLRHPNPLRVLLPRDMRQATCSPPPGAMLALYEVRWPSGHEIVG
ncbi:MAG: hypothetical protein Q9206_005241 [Seirophora lacunosa]